MTLSGSGVVLSDYHPFSMSDGSKRLLHISSLRGMGHGERSRAPTAVRPAGSPSGSSQTMQTIVRTCELLQHPRGTNGLVCLLECVHHTDWTKSERLAALDVYQLCDALGALATRNNCGIHSDDQAHATTATGNWEETPEACEGNTKERKENEVEPEMPEIMILDEKVSC